MTLDERGAKLEELEGARKLARAESKNLQTCAERIEEPERDRDALLKSYAGMVPRALDELPGEEKDGLYGMLRSRSRLPRQAARSAALFVHPNLPQRLRHRGGDPRGRRHGDGPVSRGRVYPP